MSTSFVGLNAAGPGLLPLLGSAAILSFDYFEAVYYSTFLRTSADEIPNTAVSKFWDRSLTVLLTSVAGLYGGTAIVGGLAWNASERGGLLRRYMGLGTLFTLGHFTFAYSIAGVIEGIMRKPETAREGQWRWLLIHAVRTMTTDIPAFVCFLAAVWHGW